MRSHRSWGANWNAAAGVAVALLLAAPAGAWGRPQSDRPPAGPRGAAEDGESMRDDIQETVEIYMVARMKRFLALTESQERIVIPLIEDLNNSRREMNKSRRLIFLKLLPLIEDETASDQEMTALVRRLDEMDRRFRGKEFEARDRIAAALSPRQQAQFIIFQEKFRREMEERLRRLHQADGPGPGPDAGPGGPRGRPPLPSRPRSRP